MGQLIVHREGPVLSLQLSNPGKANALDLEMLAALDRQAALVEQDDSIRAVVLRGSPGGTFSSGADIREWSPMSPEVFARDWIDHGNTIFRRFEQLRCATVAAIEGLCFGGGLELALCADIRVATTNARLRFPEVAIGAIPGWEGGTRLARLAGTGRALEAVLTSREIDAATADRWGVFNALWPVDGFERELATLLDRLVSVSPQAAALAKSLIVKDSGQPAHAEAARRIKSGRDSQIGIRAFFDKQAAVF